MSVKSSKLFSPLSKNIFLCYILIAGLTTIIMLYAGVFASKLAAAESFGRFEGRLKLEDVASEYINSGPYDPGHTEFRLLEDYIYIDSKGKRWTVPAGTVVNGASIPKPVWSLLGGPWDGEYRNAAVLHDFMCENLIESSDFTHRLFFEAMLSSGVPKWAAKTMYFAVKKGGPKWIKKPGFFPPVATRGNITVDELRLFSEVEKMEDLSLDQIDAMAKNTTP
jgi:hypothetical protein